MPNVVILTKLTCKGTLRQVFYLYEAPSPPMTPYPPSYTLYMSTYREGGRGGELTREKVRGAIVHKPGRNTNMTDCISSLQTQLDEI
jgi:hypothetical protein